MRYPVHHIGTAEVAWQGSRRVEPRSGTVVRGRTKTQAKKRLEEVREETKAGVRTSPTYTIEQCVQDWLTSDATI